MSQKFMVVTARRSSFTQRRRYAFILHPLKEGPFSILLPVYHRYGFGVKVWSQEGVGHPKRPTLRLASTHYVLWLNPIKGILSIVSLLTHTQQHSSNNQHGITTSLTIHLSCLSPHHKPQHTSNKANQVNLAFIQHTSHHTTLHHSWQQHVNIKSRQKHKCKMIQVNI